MAEQEVLDPTDGREKYCWKSKYPDDAIKLIRIEAAIVYSIFFLSVFLVFASWKGWVCGLFILSPEKDGTLKKYSLFASSGMLGGITFGMKYFYRCVARGWWHRDRRVWRIMSPAIAMAISAVIGAMIDSNMMATHRPLSGPAIFAIGFLSGYFADDAVSKMSEIAKVFFGNGTSRAKEAKKGGDDNQSQTKGQS